MMKQESRKCNKCKYGVTYCIIDDAHSRPTTQFVATMLKGRLKGSAAVTDKCPKCGSKLSLKSTTIV